MVNAFEQGELGAADRQGVQEEHDVLPEPVLELNLNDFIVQQMFYRSTKIVLIA